MTDASAAAQPRPRRHAFSGVQDRLREAGARSARRAPLTFERQFTTPEGAELTLRIANASERAGAFVIDAIILLSGLIGGAFLFSWVFDGAGSKAGQIGSALFGLYVFILRNFYFVLFEAGRRAATPGKRLIGLRVASRDGGRLTGSAVITRNLVREVEVFLPFYFVIYLIAGFGEGTSTLLLVGTLGLLWTFAFTLFPLFNRDRLRLGDLLAGTWVVHVPKPVLASDLAAAPRPATGTPAAPSGETFTAAELDHYGIHELQVLEDILRNAAPAMKHAVAARILAKIGRPPARNPDEAETFLRAYYPALRLHLESGLALGRARRHKNDGR